MGTDSTMFKLGNDISFVGVRGDQFIIYLLEHLKQTRISDKNHLERNKVFIKENNSMSSLTHTQWDPRACVSSINPGTLQ